MNTLNSEFVTDDNTGGFYVCECENCGLVFNSKNAYGGGLIADTGDYGDSYCPECGFADPAECENPNLVWNVQQAKINRLEQERDQFKNQLDRPRIALLKELNSLRAQLKAAQEQKPYRYIVNDKVFETEESAKRFAAAAKSAHGEEYFVAAVYAAPVPANHFAEERNMAASRIEHFRKLFCEFVAHWDSHDIAGTVEACFDFWVETDEFKELMISLQADHIPDAGKMVDAKEIIRYGGDRPMCMWACIQHLIRAADILLNQKNYDGTGHEILSEAKCNAEKYLTELLVKQNGQSPRITEQDAREIINSAVGFMYDDRSAHSIDYWLHEDGRALLNKLNAGRADHIAEAGKMIEILRSTTAVAITMLFDSHKFDVLKMFTVDELSDVSACTKKLEADSVEKIYRIAWDAANHSVDANKMVTEWKLITEQALKDRPDWLDGPLWVLCDGDAEVGYYEWEQGYEPDRIKGDNVGDRHAIGMLVMPLVKPAPPKDGGAQ